MGFMLRTFGLLSILTVLLVAIGYVLGLWLGVSVTYTVTGAFALAMVINLFSYWYSHKWVLKMYKAKIVDESEDPKLHEIVGRLASRANLPKPQVAVTPDETPNAFATGRNPSHAVIAVTKGARNLLSERELEGVLGHEMAHIKNRDMLVNTMAAMIAGAIAYIGIAGRFGIFFGRRRGGLLALLALIFMPIAAMMVRMAISRTREFGADEEGANISGEPLALADGLRKIESAVKHKQALQKGQEEGNPATSHLFIVNPFRGADLTRLFSTHPSTEERVQRLEKMV
ncbi:hypothetical protein AKJ43_00620 [candidate division MSBL1 archaeon SCGC-AAA261D19]|uniref:Protease HtpX homolog n=1 Tax=candidate division MSBL1 archaeon SCGC-AAA261D19 TaxID=1698273 RepID=A0A133V8M5_9EURY|nr:hypothetical protein AKJ43_00620 [candidate division MSBL1 archaeon SCGC-AAA261D19]